MKPSSSPGSNITQFLRSFFKDKEKSLNSVWPFFLILSIVLTATFVWVIYQNPPLQRPGLLVPLVGILIVHILLHWISPFVTWYPRWLAPMMGLHGALAFSLVMITRSSDLAYPLYMGLIGETVGIFQKNWQRVAGVLVYLGLSILNLHLLGDQNALNTWYTVVVPMTVFVVIYVILYTREAVARSRAQELLEELEEANRQLAEYASRIEQLERQRMARELHDTLAQGLAGLILQLEAADSHLSSQRSERAQEIVQQAMQRARTTLADARRAIDNLRSTTSDRDDLTAAIQKEIDHLESTTCVGCSLEMNLPDIIPVSINEQVLRMVSEGLTNIAHHARAKNAWVNLSRSEDDLLVIIRDDGIGLPPDADRSGSGHYGLLGMRERARLAGGIFEYESEPGVGTTLRLRLPLKET
jgi:two-component system, NarL family, sensor histidine kinase YdfH